jgi:hypothetical protein
MKSSMKGQEKCDLLIQVTAWAGLTVYLTIHVRAEALTTRRVIPSSKYRFLKHFILHS